MAKRKLPFGYRISMGEVVADQTEAELVRKIFEQYVLGISYLGITEMLKKQPVLYQEGRLWNKNMVARILEDSRYIEGNSFPAIVPDATFRRAAEKRSTKQCPVQKTAAQKILHRLCKGTVTADIEPQVLALLDDLISDPQGIQFPPSENTDNSQTTKIQDQLNEVMEQQPVDEDKAIRLAMQLVSAQYACISSNEYETARLQRYFSSLPQMFELDAEVLRTSTKAVRISRGKVRLTLTNGQIIEMR